MIKTGNKQLKQAFLTGAALAIKKRVYGIAVTEQNGSAVTVTKVYSNWKLQYDSSSQTYTVLGHFNTNYLDPTNHSLTIPDNIDDGINGSHPITKIGDNAFLNDIGIKTLTIPLALTTIGANAFKGCTALTTVAVKGGNTKWAESKLASLGSGVFEGCTSLNNVILPTGVTSLPNNAFKGTTALRTLTFQSDLNDGNANSIGTDALPSGLTAINYYGSVYQTEKNGLNTKFPCTPTCRGSFGLIYDGNKVVGDSGSTYLHNKNYIALGEKCGSANTNLTTIAFNTVSGKSSASAYLNTIVHLDLPSNLTTISQNVLSDFTNLNTTTLNGDVKKWLGITGLQYLTACNENQKHYYFKINSTWGTQATIGSTQLGTSITSIPAYAFYCDADLITFDAPQNITAIGAGALTSCRALTTLSIHGGTEAAKMTGLPAGLCAGCINISTVTLPFIGLVRGEYTGTAFVECKKRHIGNLFCIENTNPNDNTNYYQVVADFPKATDVSTKKGYFWLPKTLSKVTLGGLASDTCINSSALNKCTYSDGTTMRGISTLDLSESKITVIHNDACLGCKSLTSVTFPNTLRTLEYNTFGYCSGLTSIEFPGSLREVGDAAFGFCTTLNSIKFNDPAAGDTGTLSIGASAFYTSNWDSDTSVSSLTSIQLPKNLATVGTKAFLYAKIVDNYGPSSYLPDTYRNKWSIKFTGTAADWGQVSFASATSNPLRHASSFKLGTTELTELNYTGTSKLKAYTFMYCPQLKKVTLNTSSLTNATENYTFFACTNLKTLYLHPNITAVSSYAFEKCPLETISSHVNISSSLVALSTASEIQVVNIIGGSSFTTSNSYSTSTGKKILELNIGGTITSISDGALKYCSGLTKITIPFVGERVKTASDTNLYPFGYIFGTSSYEGSTAVTQYYYGSYTTTNTYYIPSNLHTVTVTGGNILRYAFNRCPMLTSITIPNSATSIGFGAFEYCSGLSSITIPNSVTNIEESAFYGCTGLTSVTIRNGVTSIGRYAFRDCSGLTSVAIPNSVTTIERSAFAYCSGLTSVTIGSGVTNIEIMAFERCTGLTSITIPGNVTSIGNYVFQYCTGLTSVTIRNGVTSIGAGVFESCSGLTSITIPASVASIGSGAFYNCSGLTSVTIGSSVKSIGSRAFASCTGLTSITIPSSMTSIDSYAFYNCTSLTSVTFKKTTGWFVAVSSSSTSSTPVNVNTPSTNATYLKTTYLSKYWFNK